MSASYFRTLFGYNRWAWGKVLDQVAQLSPEEYESRQFNFGSVRSTLLHVSTTEALYMARQMGKPTGSRRSEEDFPSFDKLRVLWEQQFEDQKAFAASLTDDVVSAEFSYLSANGQTITGRRDIALAQLFNHSTQHRSETAVAITEFGHSPGDLDVNIYVREHGPTP